MKLKEEIYYWIGIFVHGLSKFFAYKEKKLSADEALLCLKKEGYPFLPLWGELPVLHESSIDLSIIVPVYNAESYLKRNLESLIIQNTHYQYEVICINDGSSDNSLSIINRMCQKYPSILRVYTQENCGISAARNKGLELANGNYVGFVDNDDYVSPDYVETILNVAYKNSVDLVQTGFKSVKTDGSTFSTNCYADKIINKKDISVYLHEIQGYIWGGCMKKDLFSDMRFPIGFWYEDMITRMLLIRKTNSIAIVGKTLYFKLIHKENASKILWKNADIKSADQYWLARSFSEYSLNKMNMSIDTTLVKVLLTEWSIWLWGRTRSLSRKVRKSLFILAADYFCSLKYNQLINDKYLDEIRTCFESKQFQKWELLCVSMLLKRKANR